MKSELWSEEMTLEDMLNMPLNSVVCGRDITIQRVPGGWIYDGKQDVFIPEPELKHEKMT